VSLSTGLRILVGLTALAAFVIFIVIGPWRGGSSKPVLHAVIQRPEPGDANVLQREEYWWDSQRNLLHYKSFLAGKIVGQGLKQSNPNGKASLSPALDTFVTGYRQALTTGKARETGTGTVDGKHVIWVTLADGTSTQRVAVDPTTYRPLEIEQLAANGKPEPGAWQVQTIELLPRLAADFVSPS
jgi:hypothetical protein